MDANLFKLDGPQGLRAWLILMLPFFIIAGWLGYARPAEWPQWLNLLVMAQIAMGEWARRRCLAQAMPVFGAEGWIWAVLALTAVQMGQWGFVSITFAQAGLAGLVLSALGYLIKAYFEELWFRGLLIKAMPASFSPWVICVTSALVFGLYHWQSGWMSVLFTTAIGLVLVAARLAGSSILMLTIAHACMNWLNQALLPPGELRFGFSALAAGFWGICLLAAFLIIKLSNGGKHNKGNET